MMNSDTNMKTWIFGSYKWQGNPKALFLYMAKYHEDKDCWWIAETEEQHSFLQALGVQVAYTRSSQAAELFSKADVYVVENFREQFPETLNPDVVMLNLWHGVGLKHIELALGAEMELSSRIVRKHIRNLPWYRNNQLFLVTSEPMERHFVLDAKLTQEQILRGSYPRNIVSRDPALATYDHEVIGGRNFSDYDQISIYAPTWRRHAIQQGEFTKLIPDLSRLASLMQRQNSLLIIKMHPSMEKDSGYIRAREAAGDHPNLLFWDDSLDIYEILHKINLAIVDYSSIFYDLLEAGVSKFIRHIPDYEAYVKNEGFTQDYLTHTDGLVTHDFESLLEALSQEVPPITRKEFLRSYFFGYSAIPEALPFQCGDHTPLGKQEAMEDLIARAEAFKPAKAKLPILYSYDVFDTLIRRKALSPISVFFQVGEEIAESTLSFPPYLIANYSQVRRECEADVRDNMRKTTHERGTERIEITFQQIFDRMQRIYALTEQQVAFLMETELRCEFDAVEPIHDNIRRLLLQQAEGHDVVLVSDMYLPLEAVRGLLAKADARLASLPLYLSTDIGHQKSTGKLFLHIFFDLDYHYSQWIHYGDNKHADGAVPRRLGISTRTHDIDSFIPFESEIATELQSHAGYQLATQMQRYRWSMLDRNAVSFNEAGYFSYAYVGSYLTPYVNWTLRDALRRGYKTLYFISRDGHYLKAVADAIIAEKGYDIKTRLIYGSRKAWRFATPKDNFEDEFFSPFGAFGGVKDFKEVVAASQLTEEQLLAVVPALAQFRDIPFLAPEDIRSIAACLAGSRNYRQWLEEVRKERFELVKDYLAQEISFDERFAFVEFWGRGYTQNLLTELLSSAANREVENPFYYIRCLRDDEGNSIRHRFSQSPIDYWFIEPIFATVPHESVVAYTRQNGSVTPMIVPSENEFHTHIFSGIVRFAQDYARLNVRDEDSLDRLVSSIAYKYHLANPHDQYLCNIYARLKDNRGTYEAVREVAPVLTAEQIRKTPPAFLSSLTMALPISLSRSSEAARLEYSKKRQQQGLSPNLPEAMKPFFPNASLDRYVRIEKSPQIIYSAKDQDVYFDISFTPANKSGAVLGKGQVAEVRETVWTRGGIPRLKLDQGYITAHSTYVKPVTKLIAIRDRSIPETLSDVTELDSDESVNVRAGEILDVLELSHAPDKTRYLRTDRGYVPEQLQGFIIACPDIDDHIHRPVERVVLLKAARLHPSLPSVHTANKAKEWKAGSIFEVIAVEWKEDGTPFLKTPQGYVSAHRDVVHFVRKSIDDYIFQDVSMVQLLKDCFCHSSVDCTPGTRTGDILKAGEVARVISVEWTEKGTPRLRTDKGYVLANVSNHRCVRADIENYLHQPVSVVRLLQDLPFHKSVDFVRATKTGEMGLAGEVLKVLSIEWTGSGTPRLKTDRGFVSANLSNVAKVRNDIEQFLSHKVEKIVLLKKFPFYNSVDFIPANKAGKLGKAGDILNVLSIEWTEGGTPRLRTENGFVSANLSNVRKVRDDIESFLLQDGGEIVLLKDQPCFRSVDFIPENRTGDTAQAGEVLQVLSMGWTEAGTPRLETGKGFISANLSNVARAHQPATSTGSVETPQPQSGACLADGQAQAVCEAP